MSLLFTQLKLNWYKAADKGALCRARVKLIHAEELSRGKKSPKAVQLPRFPTALGSGGSLSAPGMKHEAGQAA